MADASYEALGGHPFSGKPIEAMPEPDTVFDVLFHEGQPVAFFIIKPTRDGLKSTLMGTDGSVAGKSSWRNYFACHRVPGYYVEASGKFEAFALSRGIPTVPVEKVAGVLSKQIEPDADGFHYSREILINCLKHRHNKSMSGLPWSLNTAKPTQSPTSSTSTKVTSTRKKTERQSTTYGSNSPSRNASTVNRQTPVPNGKDLPEPTDGETIGALRMVAQSPLGKAAVPGCAGHAHGRRLSPASRGRHLP